MVKTILSNGGATLNNRGQAVTLKTGFQVSHEDCYCIGINQFTEQFLANVLTNKLSRGWYWGVWVDNGLVYIDKSRRISCKKAAIQAGKQLKQLSIFDWKKQECIYLNK